MSKLFGADPRLNQAYKDGFRSLADDVNPHQDGTLEGVAWDEGHADTHGTAPVGEPVEPDPVTDRPNASWTKATIREWLSKVNIPFSGDETKNELLDLVESNPNAS